MRKFKKADFWISVYLIIACTIFSLLKADFTFIICYLIVGLWHVISMITHAWKHWFTEPRSARAVYHWITFFSLITMPLGSYLILFFIAPAMAIFYTYLCYNELYVKMRRPLAQLR